MKVLLVYPNDRMDGLISVGVSVLSAHLKATNHQVQLYDTTFIDTGKKTGDYYREQLGQIIPVDISKHGVVRKKMNLNQLQKDFREKAKEWSDRLTIIKGYTLDVVDQIPDKSLDFVFHDSDHSYPFVVNEIKAYLPKLKDGGFCMGDDIEWDPVSKSVGEMFGSKYNTIGRGVWYKQI